MSTLNKNDYSPARDFERSEIAKITQSLTHLKGYEVKYFSATNTKGARIKITDTRLNKYEYLPYDYAYSTIWQQAAVYLLTIQNIKIVSFTWNEYKGTYTLLTEDFTSELI